MNASLRVARWIATGFVLLGCQGCPIGLVNPIDEYPNVNHEKLGGLSEGLSRAEVEKVLGERGAHQFSATLPQGNAVCVSYYRSDVWGDYNCLFIDDKLTAVYEAPAFQGSPEDRMNKVLSTDNLIGERLRTALTPTKKAPSSSKDWGLGAAVVAVGAVGTLATPVKQVRQRNEFHRLYELLDPFKVELGATLADVEARLGAPIATETKSESRQFRYYGSIKYAQQVSSRTMLLAIVYENEKVSRVFSHEFMDDGKVYALAKFNAAGP